MRSGLHSLRLGSSHMVPWLEPDPETASTPGTQGRRRNGQTLYSLWAITDANFIRLSCLITACQRCSLMTLLAPGCGIHYCVPGPGPAWGVHWRQPPVAMSSAVLWLRLWWPEPGPRVSSGSGLSLMTREPGHTGLACSLGSCVSSWHWPRGHRHCVLIWANVATCDHIGQEAACDKQ